MDTYIKIGQSTINKYSTFADNNKLDDENEYFPTLRIIIDGTLEAYDGAIHNKIHIKKELVDFAKKLYINTWIQYGRDDEDDPNVEKETNEAIQRFDELYFQ